MGAFVSKFEDPKDKNVPASSEVAKDTGGSQYETPARRRLRIKNEKMEKVSETVRKRREEWDPRSDEDKKTKNAYNTLFVANIPYETLETTLQDEFEVFGPVTSVVMPKNREGMPTGYAFVEFERERDMKAAWREANGMRIRGRRILVDVERGRTVEDWLPNRLDGPHNSCTRKRRNEKHDGRLRTKS